MKTNLFNEFEPTSAKQWKQKIQVDLKGADYNKTLIWNSEEGISVNPFYHKDEFSKLEIPQDNKELSICQTIRIYNEAQANKEALKAIENGVIAIKFIADKPFNSTSLLNGLSSIKNKKIDIHFQFNFLSENFIKEIITYQKKYNIYLNIDIIGNIVKTGNWFSSHKTDHLTVSNLINNNSINAIGVNAEIYQNAGANIVQQIAYALSHANEYLNYFGNKIANKIQFNFAIGSNYFFEIAKIRAFKFLWFQLLKEYNVNALPQIFAEPSLRNKIIYDYNVNMIRTTSECMSAILGGVSTISNVSYDILFKKSNEFGNHIARNQLLIIQEESHFKKAINFAEGSYYIETLTKQIVEKALNIFNEIEKNGGLISQLQKGTIQRKIKESAKKEQLLFDKKTIVLVGTNKYQNKEEVIKDNLEINPFTKSNPVKTLIEPVLAKRLSEKLEQERLNSNYIL